MYPKPDYIADELPDRTRRYPPRYTPKYTHVTFRFQDDGASYWPFCVECGAETKEYDHHLGIESLFGRRRHRLCPRCEAKEMVESLWRMHEKLVPGRDEEDWLDLLSHSHPEAFELGVLPGYWFEFKLQELPIS